MWSGKMDRGPIDLLQRYSDILTNAFMALQYCPFQNTVPVALQTCLFMSKKILEALEALEKKEWTHEKIATTVSTINNYIYHHIGNYISYRYISYFPYIKLFSYYIHTSTGCWWDYENLWHKFIQVWQYGFENVFIILFVCQLWTW